MAPSSQTSRNRSLSVAGVRHHRRVELLGARPRLPPLEEARRASAPRATWVSESQDGATGHLGQVDRLPVDRAGRVLHQQPGAPAGQAAGEVGGEGQLGAGVRAGRRRRSGRCDHDVLERRPVVVVEQPEVVEHHEVGRHRHVGGVPRMTSCSAVKKSSRASEPKRGKSSSWVGLLKVVVSRGGRISSQSRVALAPERRAPRVVQRVEGVVAALEPDAEGDGAVSQ